MASNKISVTDLEFDSIKSNLKAHLKSQTQFQDYDFEGSSMDVLMDVLAYNTHYMAYYANMLGNEMFLDTASLRSSVVSHAKHLNVIPTSVTAPTAYLNMTFTPDNSPVSLTIAKDTQFKTVISGNSYTFTTTTATTIFPVSGLYYVNSLAIKEGTLLNNAYTADLSNPNQRFLIPNPNVDTSTVTVKVQNSASDSTLVTWADGNSLDITTISSTQKVYFLQEVEEQKYEIFFGDGAVGKQLADGNIVFIEYLSTGGVAANKASTFIASGAVAGLTSANYTLTTAVAATGGAAIESMKSLKINAPKLYQAQKRSTTKDDYKALLLQERPDIESLTVFGGEEASPPVYGKVYIAIKPTGNTSYSNTVKDNIKSSILKKSNVVTVIPEFVDPIFYYVLIDTVVNYDPVVLLTTEDVLKASISTSINSYFTSSLQKFDQKFRYSVLTKMIDNTDNAIRNSRTTIKYQMRMTPQTLGTTSTYTLEFNAPLTKSSVVSTAFTASDGNTYYLLDDGAGIIKVVRAIYTSGVVTSYSPTTYFTIADGSQNQGTIDYDTGKIVLNNFNPYAITDGTTNIKFNVTPLVNNQDVTPLREQILTTDTTDTTAVVVTMISETII